MDPAGCREEEVVRLRPVRCERVHPAHGWVNQSPAEPQSLTDDDSERALQNHGEGKTRSLAAASTTAMTGSFSFFAPGGAKRAGVGCHGATNRFDKTTTE